MEQGKQTALLASYLKRLAAGEALDSVRRDFVRHFASVMPEDIMAAEQELVRGGTPLREVQRLCDLHSALFHGRTEAEVRAERAATERAAGKEAIDLDTLPAGHPVSLLRRENEALLRLIQSLQHDLALPKVPENFTQNFLTINAIRAHYAKKEELLMPVLYRYGVTGPSEVMWGVDDEIKKEIGLLSRVLKEDAANAVIYRGRIQAVLKRAEEMVYKEEKILFPLSLRYFTPEEWYAIYRDCPEMGTALLKGEQPHWQKAEAWLFGQAAREKGSEILSGKVQLAAGELTVRELRAIFALLPVDLTFIDRENVLRFFTNEGKIFARPRAALGREVFDCHPPQIVPMIKNMLEDFKAKRRTHMDVARRIAGRPVLVRYAAVYDEAGEYLGTLEIVQDVSAALEKFAK